MKERFKYIIFQHFSSFKEFAKFLGQTKGSLYNWMSKDGKLPEMAKFVILVFDKMEEEKRGLKEEVRLLKKQAKLFKAK